MNGFDFFHTFSSLPLWTPLFQDAILYMYVLCVCEFRFCVSYCFVSAIFLQSSRLLHSFGHYVLELILFYDNEQRGTIDSQFIRNKERYQHWGIRVKQFNKTPAKKSILFYLKYYFMWIASLIRIDEFVLFFHIRPNIWYRNIYPSRECNEAQKRKEFEWKIKLVVLQKILSLSISCKEWRKHSYYGFSFTKSELRSAETLKQFNKWSMCWISIVNYIFYSSYTWKDEKS